MLCSGSSRVFCNVGGGESGRPGGRGGDGLRTGWDRARWVQVRLFVERTLMEGLGEGPCPSQRVVYSPSCSCQWLCLYSALLMLDDGAAAPTRLVLYPGVGVGRL